MDDGFDLIDLFSGVATGGGGGGSQCRRDGPSKIEVDAYRRSLRPPYPRPSAISSRRRYTATARALPCHLLKTQLNIVLRQTYQ